MSGRPSAEPPPDELLRWHCESLFPSVALFYDEAIELAKRLRALTPDKLNKVFLTDSGTESFAGTSVAVS